MTGQNGSKPLTEFVADLERLRREAGQPSLRKMSETGHYSHTALAGVLSGARLPSQELTLAFVRACGGDEDAWRARWSREHALRHGIEPDTAPPAHRGAARPRAPWWVLVPATALATVAIVALLAGAGVFTSRPLRGAVPSPVPSGAGDGTDPQEQRCQLDAVSAQTVPVPDPDPAQPSYGSLTLRYSPRCRGAWPLFVSSERVPAGATIRLRATRPADGAVSEFDYPFLVHNQVFSVFGNILQTGRGCVSVAVRISAADGRGQLAGADTPCVPFGPGA